MNSFGIAVTVAFTVALSLVSMVALGLYIYRATEGRRLGKMSKAQRIKRQKKVRQKEQKKDEKKRREKTAATAPPPKEKPRQKNQEKHQEKNQKKTADAAPPPKLKWPQFFICGGVYAAAVLPYVAVMLINMLRLPPILLHKIGHLDLLQ